MLVRIIQGRLLVLELRTRCLQVLFVRCRLLLRGRSRLNSSRTVIASSVTADRPVVEDRSEYDVWFRHDTQAHQVERVWKVRRTSGYKGWEWADKISKNGAIRIRDAPEDAGMHCCRTWGAD